MKRTEITEGISLKNNRKLRVFLVFLLLTSIIWLLIQLSKTSTSTISFKVAYSNLPANKLLLNAPVSEVKLSVKAPGFTLLRLKAKKEKIAFSLTSVKKINNRSYILPNAQLSKLNDQFSTIEVLNVFPDTIFVDLGVNISKKVPVKAKLDIKFKLGYNFMQPVKIIPDSVLVTGSELVVSKITEISTTNFKRKDVYESIQTELNLENPAKKKNVKLSTTKVKVVGKVDKFTEGKFKIPVIIINQPHNILLNPFPKEIELIYQAAISNFNKITKSSFNIVFDYNEYKNDTLIRYLTPIIQQKSPAVHTLKINPSKIEFLIQKVPK